MAASKDDGTVYLVPDVTKALVEDKDKEMPNKRKLDKGLFFINHLILSVAGKLRGQLVVKTTPITDDYGISTNVLGLGISGKIVKCSRKPKSKSNDTNTNNTNYALKIFN